MREKGKIRKYVEDRGFGFIEQPNGPALFFHVSAVTNLQAETQLQPGVAVEFDIQTKTDRPRAENVVLL